MKLHYHPLSSYSRKTAIGIGLRGDAVEMHVLDVFAGALRTPDFQAMSPFGKMPVLEGPAGGPIFESTSILEYLEELGPRVLLPSGLERQCRHLDRVGDLYLLNPIGEFFWRKTPDNRERAVTVMGKAWALWERELADGRPYVLGDAITLPDLSAAVAAHYSETEGVPLPSSIAAYHERLLGHPVIAASRDAALPFVEASKPRRTA